MKARFTWMISLGLLANCTCMFAADADAPAGHAAPAAAPAFTAKIELDRVEFLLGDSIPAKFVMQNNSNVPERYAPGGIYPTLRLLKEFRLTAFKIDEQGKPANKPVTNWPMPMDFGGPRPIVGPFVQPGEN